LSFAGGDLRDHRQHRRPRNVRHARANQRQHRYQGVRSRCLVAVGVSSHRIRGPKPLPQRLGKYFLSTLQI
jgi:hypothetical protein